MMKTIFTSLQIKTLLHLSIAVAIVFALSLQGFAQTAAGTPIDNRASATYSDGGGNNFSTVSNTVTVTVARVAGLAITPDGQTNSSVVPGQTTVPFTFRVTNTGNFTDNVRFLASGASVRVVGSATVASAVIVGPNTDILTNGADVLHSLAQNGFVDILVNLNISSGAAAGSTIRVFLGDAASGTNFDNIASNSSANEVRTVSTSAVNGSREARGDIQVTVENDGQIRANLTVPSGPVALGSDITYTLEACNTGLRPLTPVGVDTSIYVVAPIPVGTVLTNVGSLQAGTQFSTSPLSTPPLSATWVNSAPGTLSTVRRIRIPVAASLAAGACSSNFNFDVTITTTNANTPIYAIVDAFAENSVNATVTDQSGDTVSNKGDTNSNFDEPLLGGTVSPTQGFQQPTTLAVVSAVLLGPNGAPSATGPTNNNDDFTNKSVTTGIAAVAPGGVTTASGQVVFTNTVQNTGNSNDTYTLTAPTVPAGATVEISTNGGTSFTTVSGGGSVNLAVTFGNSANFLVRVTLPTGQTVLTGYDTVIRATSQNDNTKFNDTIDRVYTGFLRLVKSFTVTNGTGVGAATDAVPGAVINYTITYTNVSSTGGSGSVTLTVNNLVITENGNTAPNNWGTTTDQVVGSGGDSGSGTIAGDSVGSNLLTDTIGSVAPGASGTFTFSRTIK